MFKRPPPLSANILTAAGIALHEAGHWHEAEALLTAALDARPYDPLAMWHRGLVRLALGNFAEGWKDYGYRLLMNAPGGLPLWINPTVDDLAGRNVFVHGEQGIGDEIMFASCINDLCALADTRVMLTCDDRLRVLFNRSFPGAVCVAKSDYQNRAGLFNVTWPDVVHVAAGSLPHAFRQRREDFSGAAYLKATPMQPALNFKRIGLCWNGGTADTRGALRSIDADRLCGVLNTGDALYINLTHDAQEPDEGFYGSTVPGAFESFDSLASVILACDLIVTVQCSIAHLAGALGVPCLVLLSAAPEWRYGALGPAMPWYQSVELTRQERLGDWTVPLARARERVAELVRAKRTA